MNNNSCLPIMTTKTPKIFSKKLPFTSSERDLIVALVRDRPIIEDKRTHAQNIELKKKAWDELTMAYNAQSYVTPRNNIQLKRCWENIKSKRKKELSVESINMRRTGGGPPEVLDLEVVSDKPVNQSINTKIDTNFYDSENCVEVNEVMNVDNDFLCEKDKNVHSQPKKRKEISTSSTGIRKICSETEARIKRCAMNMQQDSELHELRIKREKALIQREENLIDFEKQLHGLQVEKIKLEIELLKKQLQN